MTPLLLARFAEAAALILSGCRQNFQNARYAMEEKRILFLSRLKNVPYVWEAEYTSIIGFLAPYAKEEDSSTKFREKTELMDARRKMKKCLILKPGFLV